MDLERFMLTEAKLRQHGGLISKLRKRIAKEAMQTAEDKGFNLQDAEREVEVLGKIIRQRSTPRDDA